MSGGREGVLELALERSLAGSEDGVPWLHAAVEVRPEGHHAPAYLATALATYDRCGEASRALEVAEERASNAQREECGWLRQARETLAQCGIKEPELAQGPPGVAGRDPTSAGTDSQLP